MIDISPSNLDSNLCFMQPSVSHDVLCIKVKYARWQYTALMYSFSYLEAVCCSMSSSNCFFLTCIQISQETGQVVWYAHLFHNFLQFIVTQTVKGFLIVNKEEVDVFLELSCFFDDPIWSLVHLPFLNPAWTFGSSQFTYCSSLAWKFLSIMLLVCEMSAIVW